jgi:hypothetical protein
MCGDFAPDRRVAAASASKMVSGLVLFRLIEHGYLSPDSAFASVHVAARMAEVVTDSSWNQLFAQQLLQPHGLSTDLRCYTAPR